MYAPFYIAKRYFSTRPKSSLIHRMGLIAYLSVALSTMALLLVLSVFNGLEGVVKKLFYAFDPDIKVQLRQGKYFTLPSEQLDGLKTLPGIAKIVEVVEENVLFIYADRQLVAKLKGVSDNFIEHNPLEKHILRGELKLKNGDENLALVGAGIQYALSIRTNYTFEDLQVFFPRPNKQLSIINPQKMYRTAFIKPGAVFAIERYFDENYVIVPLNFVANLIDAPNHRTALEIQLIPGTSRRQVQRAIQAYLPQQFQVLNREEQQLTLMRTIRTERMLVFITFALIVAIASLNIFFILSMLVLAKRADVAILYTLGASVKDIRNIFLLDGLLIGLGGALLGMLTALVLTWIQQKFEILSLGMSTSLIEAYPVKRELTDFIYVFLGVCITTVIASYRPAMLATQVNIKEHL